VQESFGLTVIEAMAAGLPVIASNWDGYREALQDGVNGILVDSYFPPAHLGETAYRYFSGLDNYDFYVGGLSQLCFVDLEQTASAIARLAGDQALRKKLGAVARKTIEQGFEWSVVMQRYLELWREQSERLQAARQKTPNAVAWQAFDPAATFARFPSQRFSGTSRLVAGPQFERWNDIAALPGVVVNAGVLTAREQYQALRAPFADGKARSVDDVLSAFAEIHRPAVLRTLHWAVKIGLLSLAR
jgi:alpha-maltose-1-phosphate synthase